MINFGKLDACTDLSVNGYDNNLAHSLDCLLPSDTVNIKENEYRVISKYINENNEIIIKLEYFNQETASIHEFCIRTEKLLLE